jgi:hypothetical protein
VPFHYSALHPGCSGEVTLAYDFTLTILSHKRHDDNDAPTILPQKRHDDDDTIIILPHKRHGDDDSHTILPHKRHGDDDALTILPHKRHGNDDSHTILPHKCHSDDDTLTILPSVTTMMTLTYMTSIVRDRIANQRNAARYRNHAMVCLFW